MFYKRTNNRGDYTLKNSYEEKNNKLYINGNETTVPLPVKTVLDLNDRIIVLSRELSLNINVFCLDVDGNILWKIQECPHGDGAKPYTNIRMSDAGELIAYNFIGFDYRVDLNTGAVERPPGDQPNRAW